MTVTTETALFVFYFSLIYFILFVFVTFSSSPPPEKENKTDGIIQKKKSFNRSI